MGEVRCVTLSRKGEKYLGRWVVFEATLNKGVDELEPYAEVTQIAALTLEELLARDNVSPTAKRHLTHDKPQFESFESDPAQSTLWVPRIHTYQC